MEGLGACYPPYPALPPSQAYTTVTGLSSSFLSDPIQGIGEDWTLYESPLPPVRELSKSARAFLSDITIVKSASPGHECHGVLPAWVEDPAYTHVTDVTTHNSSQDRLPTSAFLYQGHQYTPADTTSNLSAPPILTAPPSTSTVVRYEEGASRNQPIKSSKTRNRRTTAPSRSSGQPTGACETPKQSYSCPTCGKEYAQTQGVMRHYRTQHRPSACLFSDCDFKWGRPEHYRSHLTRRHGLEDAIVDGILGKPAGSRSRTTIIGRDLPQNVSPAIKHDQRRQAKPRWRPLAPPFTSATKIAHVPSAFSSTEDHAQPPNDVIAASPPDGSTPADRPSGRVTALIPTLTPSDGRHYGIPVLSDHMSELSRSIHPYPVSAAGRAEIRTNAFTSYY